MFNHIKLHTETALHSLEKLEDTVGQVEKNIFYSISVTELQEIQMTHNTGESKIQHRQETH
jgi:hypothetical protein